MRIGRQQSAPRMTLAQVRYHAAELVKGLATAAADNMRNGMTEEEGVRILFDVNTHQPANLLNAALCEAVLMLAREELNRGPDPVPAPAG